MSEPTNRPAPTGWSPLGSLIGTLLAVVGLALLAFEVARTLDGQVLATLDTGLLWGGVGLVGVGLATLVVMLARAGQPADTRTAEAAAAKKRRPADVPANASAEGARSEESAATEPGATEPAAPTSGLRRDRAAREEPSASDLAPPPD